MADRRPTALTLAQAIEEYLEWGALDRGRSPNTVRAYGIDLARFRAGDQLPTVAELAALHNVAVGTAHRAIDQLHTEGLTQVSRGRRATVAPVTR